MKDLTQIQFITLLDNLIEVFESECHDNKSHSERVGGINVKQNKQQNKLSTFTN
jgi:hypothetical protein